MAALLEALGTAVAEAAYFVSRAVKMIFRFGRHDATADEETTLRSTQELVGGIIGIGLVILALGLAIAWLIER